MQTTKTDWKGFGPDPRDPSTILYVQPDDEVIPIREYRTEDGARHADLGDPIIAKDLWRESNG